MFHLVFIAYFQGTARRKKKVVHRTATTDDKKLQSTLKKLSVNNIPGVEEVNMIKDDGNVIHFAQPKGETPRKAPTVCVCVCGLLFWACNAEPGPDLPSLKFSSL
jgi:hypothetical protein